MRKDPLENQTLVLPGAGVEGAGIDQKRLGKLMVTSRKVLLYLIFFAVLYLVLLYKSYLVLNAPIGTWLEIYTIVTGSFLVSRFIIAYFYTDNHVTKYKKSDYPTVSFVIACKNEEDSIAKTIRTCMVADYPKPLECVAINDGSTDNTLAEMVKTKKIYKGKLKVIDFKENRGKREAMAEGVLVAKGEIIIFVDSDSFVAKDGVKKNCRTLFGR